MSSAIIIATGEAGTGTRAYPDEDELTTYLQSLAVFNPAKFDAAMTLINPARKAAAAVAEWERRVCWHPFFSDGIAIERRFDPPGPTHRSSRSRIIGGGRVIKLPTGIIELTSLKVGVSTSDEGVELTQDEDFYLTDSLGNHDAALYGQPYSRVNFESAQWGLPGSVRITAVYGFCLDVPDDIYEAILQYGAYLSIAEIRLNITRGLFSYKDLETEIRYGSASQVPLAAEEKMWRDQFMQKALRSQRTLVF